MRYRVQTDCSRRNERLNSHDRVQACGTGSAEERFRPEKHWYDHETGAVCARHQPRPEGQIPEVYAHAYPGRMTQTIKFPASDSKESCRAADLKPTERYKCADDVDHKNDQPNGKCVTQGDRRQ